MKLHLQSGMRSLMSPNVPTYCGTFAAVHETLGDPSDIDVAIANADPENVCTACKRAYDAECAFGGLNQWADVRLNARIAAKARRSR